MSKLNYQLCRETKWKSFEYHTLFLFSVVIIFHANSEAIYCHKGLAFQISEESHNYRHTHRIKSKKYIKSQPSLLTKHQEIPLRFHTFPSKNNAYRFHGRSNDSCSIRMNTINDDDLSTSISLDPSPNSISNAIDFIRQCGKLKRTPRTGWINRNIHTYIGNVESVADHSWRVSVMCLLLFSYLSEDDNLNVEKCIQMALFHDVAECITGDICPDDDISKDEKHNLEKNAIIKLLKLLNESRIQNINDDSGNQDAVKSAFDCQKRENDNDASRHLRNMWNEYELRETEEAKAVKDLDLLDMIVQADEYEQMISQDCDMLQEFFDGTMPSRFHNKYVKRLAQEIHFQRHQRLNTKMKSDEKQTNSSIESSGDLKCNYKELSERDNEFAFRYAKSSNVPKHIVQKVIQAYVNERKHDNSF